MCGAWGGCGGFERRTKGVEGVAEDSKKVWAGREFLVAAAGSSERAAAKGVDQARAGKAGQGKLASGSGSGSG